MTTQFVPSIAASGGYDYLVDFLRGTLRRAKDEQVAEERVQEVEDLLRELGQEIEAAAAQSPSATEPRVASPRLDALLRKLAGRSGA